MDADNDELDSLRREVHTLRERVRELQIRASRSDVAHTAGDLRDLTLREREELLAEAERIARVGTWAWNLETNAVYWSHQMYLILGYDPERDTASAEAFFAAIDPEDRERVRSESAEGIAVGIGRQVDYRLMQPDGSVRYVSMNAASLFDEQANVRRLVGTVVDLTGERQAAENLRHSNFLLQEAQRIAQLGSWQLEIATGELQWSDEFCRILGEAASVTPSDELFISRIHPEDAKRVTRAQEEMLATRKKQTVDCRILRSDGSIRHVRIRAVPRFGSTGLMQKVLGTMQDITEQVELHAQLAHTHKMDAVGRLAGGIAHDFNNLLTVVMGNLDLLEHKLATRTREIEDSFSALTSAQELTQRLLALGKKARLERRVVDPNQLARSTMQLLERVLGDQVTLRLDLTADVYPIRVDPVQVEQALVNLIVNARDALLDRGGIITVGSRPAQLMGASAVELFVADNGPGIRPELRQTVFEPFFTTKGVGGGTGLGLATVVGTVEQHGGNVQLECPSSGGAIFRLRFPAELDEKPANVTHVRDSTPIVRGDNRPVLVIEDEPMVGAIIARTLERNGFRPTWVNNPRDALRIWQADSELELVVCDVMMPEMRGPELIDLLRSVRPNLRVLFVTGYSEETVAGILSGKVLSKPFTTASLTLALSAFRAD
jgi:two-component system, cell cycle sensor histidine kinase and response regulator CckA